MVRQDLARSEGEKMTTRKEDAYRLDSLYGQITTEAIGNGDLNEVFTDEEAEVLFDLYRKRHKLVGPCPKYVGDDLYEEDLEALWAHVSGEEANCFNATPDWYEDKPDQVVLRLLLRLERAENPKKNS